MSTITAAPTPALDAAPRRRRTPPTSSRLARYTDSGSGAVREIVRVSLVDGGALVIDRLVVTQGDARLLARLAADEPRENAKILSALYLADERRGRCRPITDADFDVTPVSDGLEVCAVRDFRDDDGNVYRIGTVELDGRFPELRWTRCVPSSPPEIVHLRDLVAQVQSYEPRTLTIHALAVHRDRCDVSVCRLEAELTRLTESPIVLNRALREAVQARLARGDLSMSEIAMRCGRVKRDRRGNVSGETSWLARRIGQLPEGGQARPTPWVHSATLALIARQGLGLAPYEVEL